MTTTLNEADKLIELSKKTKAVLQIGHLERFNAAVMAVRNMITRPGFIESTRLSEFPQRSLDVDVVLDVMMPDKDGYVVCKELRPILS
jgi:predicted dehydrogenase